MWLKIKNWCFTSFDNKYKKWTPEFTYIVGIKNVGEVYFLTIAAKPDSCTQKT